MARFGDSSNTVKVAIETNSSTTGIDKTTQSLGSLRKATDDTSKSTDGLGKSSQSTGVGLASLATVSAAAGVATYSLLSAMDTTIKSANTLQASLTGLSSIATAFGTDADKAKEAAQGLATDGLMTVSDAAVGLKNLLAAGFNLDEATQLMNRFKDSAAFGRQASLGFGQAIASATEGIKNGNSILVDNAGVTKNLSNMLVDAGYSAQDLAKASDDAGVRQAIFNGIIEETNAQVGDAAKLSESAAGKQAVWTAQNEVLSQQIGTALQPALLSLLQTVTPIITSIADWVGKNPELTSGIIIGTTAILGLITVLGTFGTAIVVAKAAFTGLALLVAAPIAMPAIAVGAALASIALVAAAVNSVLDAIDAMNNAKEKAKMADDSNGALKKAADKYYAQGNKAKGDELTKLSNTKSPELNWFDKLFTGTFASGGYTGAGGVNEVAGVVHKGEYVVPQSQVDQSTGLPKALAGQGNITYITVQNMNVNDDKAMRTFIEAQDNDLRIFSAGITPIQGAV